MSSFTNCATAAGFAAIVSILPAAIGAQEQPAPARAELRMRDSVLTDSATQRIAAERVNWMRRQFGFRSGLRQPAFGRAPAVTLRSRVSPDVRRVRSVMENGSTVRLDDGTVWEVWVADRARSAGWQRGDSVRLTTIPAPYARGFDVRLENVTSDWAVAARMTGSGRR